jgi:hypothetical protein
VIGQLVPGDVVLRECAREIVRFDPNLMWKRDRDVTVSVTEAPMTLPSAS